MGARQNWRAFPAYRYGAAGVPQHDDSDQRGVNPLEGEWEKDSPGGFWAASLTVTGTTRSDTS